MNPEHLKAIAAIHDRAKAAGLIVRYWDANHGCLVIAAPEAKASLFVDKEADTALPSHP